jgi:predicted permease
LVLNTAIFQLIDAVVLRNLPVRNPRELAEVRINGGYKGFGVNPNSYGQLTRPVWEELRRHQQAFSGVFAWAPRDLRIGSEADIRRVNGIAVSGDFFDVLGIAPWRGRLIDRSDEAAPCPSSVAVVNHAFWQREFGGRDLDGQARVRIDGAWHQIVGVTPPEFFGLAVGERFDIAVPLCTPKQLPRELFDVSVIGRLRTGWTIERASAHLKALSGGIFEVTAPMEYSAAGIARYKSFKMAAHPVASGVSSLRDHYTGSLQLLLVLTALILLIACANLANLMLARAAAREREVVVRLALGASRVTLVRQFLAESLLLAATGGACGVALAQVLSRVLIWALATDGRAPAVVVATSWRVLLFTGIISAAGCVAFGLAPALGATRVRLGAAMNEEGRATTGGRRRLSVQRLMVVAQIAVSLMLLMAAFLFVRSFHKLITVDSGIRQQGVSIAFIGFPQLKLPPDTITDFQRQLVREAMEVPGVVSAATTTNIPLLGATWGHGVHVGTVEGGAQFTWVSPGYFRTLKIPVIRGRDFSWQDTQTSPRVAVVNESFVRRYVSSDPIGQKLTTNPEPGYPTTQYAIVGVIPDTQYQDLKSERPPMVFAPDSQFPAKGPWAVMMIHASLDAAAAAASVKARLTRSHAGVIVETTVFQDRVRDRLVRERLLAMLAGFFGALAAVLAMVGLYGMIAFNVAQRRREIGLRMALGARAAQVVAMMMREAGTLLALGLMVGAVMSLLAGPAAAALLFGLKPNDGPTLAAACAALAGVAALASFLPARRASRLDPSTVLRQD